MVFDRVRNAVTYFAFQFSEEMKRMYRACKYSSPDIQQSLYVTHSFSDPIHRSISEEVNGGGVEASEATACVCIAVVAEPDGNVQRKREGKNYSKLFMTPNKV